MCRGKFKKSALKGFTLLELYETLGVTKAINHTVACEGEEDGDIAPAELYVNNPIVDGWNKIISRGGRIFWDDFYKIDIASRETIIVPEVPSVETPIRGSLPAPVQPSVEAPSRGSLPAPVQPSLEGPIPPSVQADVIMTALEKGFQTLEIKIGDVNTRLNDMSARLKDVEERVFKKNVVDDEAGKEFDVREGEGDIGDKADVGEGEGDAWAMVVFNQFPQVANQIPVVEEVQDDEDEGEKVAAVTGRKRNPSKYCKTPYTRRSKRRKA